MNQKGKNSRSVRAEKLIAGTQRHLANKSQLEFASGTFTPVQVIASLQTLVTLRNDVNAAKASTKAKVAVEQTQAPTLVSFMADFESFVRTAFSKSPDVLADFGISKKAKTPPTVETKAGAAVKSKATRSARRTMGTKQRKAVKGAVTGILVTPITASDPVGTAKGGTVAPATSRGDTAVTPPHTA